MVFFRSRALVVTLSAIFSALVGPVLTLVLGALPRGRIHSDEFLPLATVAIVFGGPFGALAGAAFGLVLSSSSLLSRIGMRFWISVGVAGALVGTLAGPYIWAIDRMTTTTQFLNYQVLSWMGMPAGVLCAMAVAFIIRRFSRSSFAGR